jgi:hypothetical protein
MEREFVAFRRRRRTPRRRLSAGEATRALVIQALRRRRRYPPMISTTATKLPGSRPDRAPHLICSKCKRLREKSGGVFFGAAFACRPCFEQGSSKTVRRFG